MHNEMRADFSEIVFLGKMMGGFILLKTHINSFEDNYEETNLRLKLQKSRIDPAAARTGLRKENRLSGTPIFRAGRPAAGFISAGGFFHHRI